MYYLRIIMVYIYRKIVYGKPYYYLRLSEKIKGKTIVKDVAYLGNDVSKIEEKLPKEYKEKIRKAHKNIKKFIQNEYYLKKIENLKLKKNLYFEDNLLNEIEAIKLHYNNDFLKLDEKTKEEIYKNFLIDFAFNTTSIEGNTINLKETEKLLRENLTPKDKTLREVYDLKNTEKVFFYILNCEENINDNFVIKIHDDLLENVDERKGYRTYDVRVFKSNFEASPVKYIKTDMELLFNWYKQNKDLHPLVLAAIFHHKFEKIHPFADGNGRTGRMILNYILLRHNYPPLFIRKSKRGEYLNSMKKADLVDINNGDDKYYNSLVSYISYEMIYSYWNSFLF